MIKVKADIQYLDGFLAEIPLANGYELSCPDMRHARRVARWLEHVRETKDFVRATGTGHRYQILGSVRIENEGEVLRQRRS